jgi:hypothetical protein
MYTLRRFLAVTFLFFEIETTSACKCSLIQTWLSSLNTRITPPPPSECFT